MNNIKKMNCFLKKKIFFFKKQVFNSNRTFRKNIIWFIILTRNNKIGIGECNPILDQYALKNLKNFEIELKNLSKMILYLKKTEMCFYYKYISYSSILFGLEQAFLSLKNKFPMLYHSKFTYGIEGIPINSLMWLNSFNKDKKYAIEKMEDQIIEGFSLIKMKVNMKFINDQYFILKEIKRKYPFLKIRVDANGCFENIQKAFYYLNKFYDLGIIDSMEQPILSGNWKDMSEICKKSKLPIVLDEELENIHELKKKQNYWILLNLSLLY